MPRLPTGALLVVLLGTAALAAAPSDLPPAPAPPDGQATATGSGDEAVPPGSAAGYYLLGGNARWPGDAVARTDLVLPQEIGEPYAYCMVAPVADWALETGESAVEAKYVRLLALLAADLENRGIMGGAWVDACGTSRPSPAGSFKSLDAPFFENCKRRTPAAEAHPYLSQGKLVRTPSYVVIDSLPQLLRSSHAPTVLGALDLLPSFSDAGQLFQSEVKSLLASSKDGAVLAKAAGVLALIHPTPDSARDIAPLWENEGADEKLRSAALKAHAFIVAYGDAHGGAVSATLKDLLPEIKKINEDATPKSELAHASYCAGRAYPKELRKE